MSLTVARYLKAVVPVGTAFVAAVGVVLTDWQPDGHVVGSTWRLAAGVLFYGVCNGYGVAITPNAPPAVKRPSVHPTLVDQGAS